jgi:hypothetical protein
VVAALICPQTAIAEPVDEMLDTCGNAELSTSIKIDNLKQLGWSDSRPLPPSVVAALQDGVLAAMSPRLERQKNWKAADDNAKELVQGMTLAMASGVRIFHKDAAQPAGIIVLPPPNGASQNILRCIYGGPVSAAMRQQRKSSPYVTLYKSRHSGSTKDDPTRQYIIDINIGRFTTDDLPGLNRAPTAHLGVSLYRQTEK